MYSERMDLLDKLERRIDELLTDLDGLKKEKVRLQQELAMGTSVHEEDKRRLREELQQERDAKDAVLSRIDALLEKLKSDSEES